MEKTVKIIGLVLLVVSFLMLAAFFATIGQGSESLESAAGEAIHVPLLTDTLLYWAYGLFALAILVTVGFSMAKFVKSLATAPGKALKALIPLVLFAGIFIVSYLLGSSEKMSIIGYDGTQNEGVWAQVADMFIYTAYTLFGLVILAIVGSRIYTSLK